MMSLIFSSNIEEFNEVFSLKTCCCEKWEGETRGELEYLFSAGSGAAWSIIKEFHILSIGSVEFCEALEGVQPNTLEN